MSTVKQRKKPKETNTALQPSMQFSIYNRPKLARSTVQGHPTNLFLTLSVPHRNLAGWQNIRCSNELAGKFHIVRGFGWELLNVLAFQVELAEKL